MYLESSSFQLELIGKFYLFSCTLCIRTVFICFSQLVAVQHSGEKEWADIFDLLTRNVSNLQLCQEVEKLLLKKKIGNTEPYVKVAAHGFACTCSSSAQRPLAKNSHTHTVSLFSIVGVFFVCFVLGGGGYYERGGCASVHCLAHK